MKSFYDLSWDEKCRIWDGRVNPYDYSSGYDFQVKAAVDAPAPRKSEVTTSAKAANAYTKRVAALYAERVAGLGKTAQQLEWRKQFNKEKNQ